jgi:hypothetical protein
MAAITEDYVSFETAKLLKEKGFDSSCMGRYSVRSREFHLDCTKMCNNGGLFECAAPSQSMAMKWLRLKHKAFISITYENDGVFTANLKAPSKEVDCMIDNKHNCWFTYEEAAEAAIKYCLEKLI